MTDLPLGQMRSFCGDHLGHIPALHALLTESISKATIDVIPHLATYGATNGLPSLLLGIQAHARLGSNHTLVTSSAQQAICLTFRAMNPHRIYIREPAFFGAIRAARQLPACELVPWTTLGDLEQLMEKQTHSGRSGPHCGGVVYLSTSCCAPTGVSMPACELGRLAALATQFHAVVVEDNPFDLLQDTFTRCVDCIPERTCYISGFSKLLGPGLRVGFLSCGDLEMFRKIRSEKITADIFTSVLPQLICHHALDMLTEYLPRIQRHVAQCTVLAEECIKRFLGPLGDAVHWSVPDGGIFLSIHLAIDQVDLMKRVSDICRTSFKLLLEPATYSYLDGVPVGNVTRINFLGVPRALLPSAFHDFAQAVVQTLEISCPFLPLPPSSSTVVTVQLPDGMAWLTDKLKKSIEGIGWVCSEALEGSDVVVMDAATAHKITSHGGKRPFVVVVDKSISTLLSTHQDTISHLYQKLLKFHAGIVVGIDTTHQKCLSVTPERDVQWFSVLDLIDFKFGEFLTQRFSTRFYSTHLAKIPGFPSSISKVISQVEKHVAILASMGLFRPYHPPSSREEFGFVAMRVPETSGGGFVITGRGSSKSALEPQEDVVYVSSVDHTLRQLYTQSVSGSKASLNANVASAVFERFPDTNIILHSHIFLNGSSTVFETTPGTAEDVQECLLALSTQGPVVDLINHGMISHGASLDAVIRSLSCNHAYRIFPQWYEHSYARFQRNSDFSDLALKQCTMRGCVDVLDMCCGTGQVAAFLAKKKVGPISLWDQSSGMLDVAVQKMTPRAVYTSDMRHANESLFNCFDVITMRQAISYAMTSMGLMAVVENVADMLRPGGCFVFNAPHFKPELLDSYVHQRCYQQRDGSVFVDVCESNSVVGERLLRHCQISTLTHCTDAVTTGAVTTDEPVVYSQAILFDLNEFTLFTPEEFCAALQTRFSEVELYGKNLFPLSSQSRSVYVVATK